MMVKVLRHAAAGDAAEDAGAGPAPLLAAMERHYIAHPNLVRVFRFSLAAVWLRT